MCILSGEQSLVSRVPGDKMAESTGVEQSTGAEPDKYFNGKQWYSAKRGEWIGAIFSLSVISDFIEK